MTSLNSLCVLCGLYGPPAYNRSAHPILVTVKILYFASLFCGAVLVVFSWAGLKSLEPAIDMFTRTFLASFVTWHAVSIFHRRVFCHRLSQSNFAMCLQCGYRLHTDELDGTCPECGTWIAREEAKAAWKAWYSASSEWCRLYKSATERYAP